MGDTQDTRIHINDHFGMDLTPGIAFTVDECLLNKSTVFYTQIMQNYLFYYFSIIFLPILLFFLKIY